MVPICVITFMGQHNIQNRWENTEYVVGWQPYQDLPVYVVQPVDWEGHTCTMHRNYMLLINDTLESRGSAKTVSGEELMDNQALGYHAGALPFKCLPGNQLDSTLNLPTEQKKPVTSEMTRSNTTDYIHVPVLRHRSRVTKGQLPKRYLHFLLQENTILSSTSDIYIFLCIYLHVVSYLCTAFKGNAM